ncbi:hypothetical protein [Haloferula sp.]|uniref:hypothetical protein n=1 Tax=Haloferula sp. TaxID=2497595 RepID=UPI003AF93128
MGFVAFLGCDGAGKSAVIDGVESELNSRGCAVLRGHWCPRLFSADSGGDRTTAADDPHGIEPRGPVSSVLKLAWLWLKWWSGWLAGLGSSARKGWVIFDRYHADLLIDPRRYRYGGPAWLARIAMAMMPQPDRVLFLDAPVDVLLSRKQEVPADALASSRERYLSLCRTHSRFVVIDASKPLKEVIEAACREIDGFG